MTESLTSLINTPLQRCGDAPIKKMDRFSGFPRTESRSEIMETAKAVPGLPSRYSTLLKEGANEIEPDLAGHRGTHAHLKSLSL